MNSIGLGAAGFMIWVLLYELRGIADTVRRASDEISSMKATIDEIKEAVGESAFEAMLSKPFPLPGTFSSYLDLEEKDEIEL